MLRRMLSLAIVPLAILAGCTSSSTPPTTASVKSVPSCRPIYAALNLPLSEATKSDSEGRCLAQKLSFKGEIAGEANVAVVTTACTKPLGRGDQPPSPELQIVVAGKSYSLALPLSPPYQPQRPAVSAGTSTDDAQVEITDRAKPDTPWAATGGFVYFNPDGRSGTLNVALMRNVSGAQPGHVSGEWRCGAPAASPSPAPGPCGAIATSPGLQPADVVRLKAAPCLAQDLTLTNPVSGHADHGLGVESSTSTFKDVPCGGSDDHHYNSSVAFRVQNETFFFAMGLRADSFDPPLPTGEYGPLVPNVIGDTPSATIVSGSTTWASHDGKFSIAQDRHSGTVDMNFVLGSTNDTVHLAGSWRCAS